MSGAKDADFADGSDETVRVKMSVGPPSLRMRVLKAEKQLIIFCQIEFDQ